MATTGLEEEKLALFFEDLEEDEPESDDDLEVPMPGFALVKRVMLQMAEDNRLPPFFVDCGYYGNDKFPADADDMELMMLEGTGNTQIYEVMLRDVPPLLDLAFPNLVLRFIFHDSSNGNIDVAITHTHKSSDRLADARAVALFKVIARYHVESGELIEDPVGDPYKGWGSSR